MIINTIILFLRDLLPLFILFSYLHVLIKNETFGFSYLLPSLILGLMGSVLFFMVAPQMSELFEGSGIERFYVALLLTSYSCLFFINTSTLKNKRLALTTKSIILVGINAFVIFKVSAFLIFFDVYFQQQNNTINVLIGCIIGLGICASFSTLFTFILAELIDLNKRIIINIIWALFLAGQITQIVTYLSQVNLIHVGSPVLHLGAFIQEASEYGHVLKALFGYEQSPSMLFIIIYSVTFAIPFAGPFVVKRLCTQFIENKNDEK